jgi:hypothetical protein
MWKLFAIYREYFHLFGPIAPGTGPAPFGDGVEALWTQWELLEAVA